MIKLNSSSILIGQIKQVLHTFELPRLMVTDAVSNIKDQLILNKASSSICQVSSDGKIIKSSSYNFGEPIMNITTKLPIRNILYDVETHKYLGKYLRFLREYKNVDLMSMYNCMTFEHLDKSFQFKYYPNPNNLKDSETITFNNNESFIIYKMPIHQQILTIGVHKNIPIEICAMLDTTGSDVSKDLASKTYVKIRNSASYFTYDKLNKVEDLDTKYWDRIQLLVKVPKSLKASLVVLEGNYIDDMACKFQDVNSSTDYQIVSELLSARNYTSNYVISEKLIEYLTGNAITPLSNPIDIEALQRTLDTLDYIQKAETLKETAGSKRYYGIWHPLDTLALKIYIKEHELNNEFDIFPFFSKELEGDQLFKTTFDKKLSLISKS